MPQPDPSQQRALQQLYEQHNDWLRSWIRKRMDCSEQAADLTHDTFLQVLLRRKAIELREPRAYLSSIARFASITGSNISFQPGTANQQRSTGLQGNHSLQQGLQQLLAGSDLQAVELGNGSFTLIMRDKGLTLEATSITGTSLKNSATTEGTNRNRSSTLNAMTSLGNPYIG
ncbi:secretin and TonB N-terminal domain-containing protein [Stutzerimonas kirkiae]|uniref:secretin and TonB N-terminal domain-containing protein n=1 Tax=Stutzerimonas kirkiae TaxID=2211392 RepID=UPI0010384E3D|nr:secretin and TonB N-terminal domain-containing protein [Stutzerimonas kirkiae]TBV15837.1 hypothetical protein DNK01_05955 [Stutzerimonas kirkiae]